MTFLRPASGACPREQLPDYVAGRLDAASTRWWDRHLVSCVGCGRVADHERTLRSMLTGAAPRVPGDLRSALVALGQVDAPTSGASPAPVAEPPLPPPSPLPVLRPGAPACHRSVLRSAVVAAAAAGATAATAWSLSVAGGGAAAAPVVPRTPPSPAPPASAAPPSSSAGAAAALSVRWPGLGGTSGPRGGTAGR